MDEAGQHCCACADVRGVKASEARAVDRQRVQTRFVPGRLRDSPTARSGTFRTTLSRRSKAF